MHCKSLILFLAGYSAAVAAGIPVELQEKKAEVTVLRSYDNWYGVTYKEDKENVMAALQKLKDEGRYPQKLWEE